MATSLATFLSFKRLSWNISKPSMFYAEYVYVVGAG